MKSSLVGVNLLGEILILQSITESGKQKSPFIGILLSFMRYVYCISLYVYPYVYVYDIYDFYV